MMTVSELARNLNVSVQAVYKKINKSMKKELSPYIKTINGQKYVEKQGEELIINSFKQSLNGLNKNQKKEINISDNADKTVLNRLSDISLNGLNKNQSEKENLRINADETVLNRLNDMFNQDNNILQDQLTYFMEQNKKLFEINQEQSNRIAELAEKLSELTRNSQILLKNEQEKNALYLTDTTSIETDNRSSEQPSENILKHNEKKRPSWQFWKR